MNGLRMSRQAGLGAVRVVEREGEPWFVASDAARAPKIHGKNTVPGSAATTTARTGNARRAGFHKMRNFDEPATGKTESPVRKPGFPGGE